MSRGNPDRDALIDLITFYREAGVTVALAETAVDRFAEDAKPKIRSHTMTGVTNDPTAMVSGAERIRRPDRAAKTTVVPPLPGVPADSDAVMEAREAARTAATLDELRELLSAFEGCPLKKTATNLCFADGNPRGRVMFVGEAPGRDEDLQGLPFVGRSGQLLDRMLAAVGLDRTSVYIANTVPWRPPGNRTPTPQETEICRPFIERQIALAAPEILVPLGSPAAKMLFGTSEGITRIRGKWRNYMMQSDAETWEIKAMATLHPAFLLRQPLQKRLAWRDFLTLKATLDAG